MRTILIISWAICLSISSSIAQTVISGQVTDAKTGEPLPYVTISGTNIKLGTVADFDGHYKITTDLAVDSLQASYMGYNPVTKVVTDAGVQTINFSIAESSASLGEIVVRPGGVKPAEVIMKRARKMKKEHNPDKIEFYEYEGYNKVQLAVDNVTDKFKKRKSLMRWLHYLTPYLPLEIVLLRKYYQCLCQKPSVIITSVSFQGGQKRQYMQLNFKGWEWVTRVMYHRF